MMRACVIDCHSDAKPAQVVENMSPSLAPWNLMSHSSLCCHPVLFVRSEVRGIAGGQRSLGYSI